MIHLVNNEQDRFVLAPNKPRQIAINRVQTLLGIDDEENQITVLHRAFGRRTHLISQFRFTATDNSPRIPKREFLAGSFRYRRDADPGDTGFAMNNGNAASRDPIKERRFPDIGSANNRNVGAGVHWCASESASVGVAFGLKLPPAFED